MPDLSIITTTYGQPQTYTRWMKDLGALLAVCDDAVEVVVVDDCGTPAVNGDEAWCRPNHLFRVDQDIPWNQPGARNLGIMHATAPVLLMVDCDMVVKPPMCQAFMDAARSLGQGEVVIPSIVSSDGRVNTVHPHNYLIRKEDMLTLGGYDEDYCGHYGWEDVQMLHLMEKLCTVERSHDLWVRHLDDVADYAVMKLNRDDGHNKNIHLRKMRELKRNAQLFAQRRCDAAKLRFPWHQVF